MRKGLQGLTREEKSDGREALALKARVRYHGEQKAKMTDRPDHPLTPEQLGALRQRFSRMSITALYDAYYAAWTRCRMESNGRPPRARFIQELVQAWKQLRKVR